MAGLDDAYRDGTLALNVAVTPATTPSTASARRCWTASAVLLTRTAHVGGRGERTAERHDARRAGRWTAETPNLYTLLVELLDASGTLIAGDRRRDRLPHRGDHGRRRSRSTAAAS